MLLLWLHLGKIFAIFYVKLSNTFGHYLEDFYPQSRSMIIHLIIYDSFGIIMILTFLQLDFGIIFRNIFHLTNQRKAWKIAEFRH